MKGDFGVIRGCPDQKKGYADRRTAKAVLAELRRSPRQDGKLAAYRCSHCGFWHVGHMPDWKREGRDRPSGYGAQ